MITLTTLAAAKLKELLAEANKDPANNVDCLRVAVKGGGCSGFSYAAELDAVAEDDIVEVSNGVKIATDPMSLRYLDGMEIDYVNTGVQSEFKFKNPNATTSCGCGSSFSTEDDPNKTP